jgi:hypothetical protein
MAGSADREHAGDATGDEFANPLSEDGARTDSGVCQHGGKTVLNRERAEVCGDAARLSGVSGVQPRVAQINLEHRVYHGCARVEARTESRVVLV